MECYNITDMVSRIHIIYFYAFARVSRVKQLLGRAVLLGLMSLATSASANDLRVVTDIAPVHSLVARVMQGVGEPVLIMSPGASPHSYNMRPSDASKLNSADVLFWIGPMLTPWLSKAVSAMDGDSVSVELLQAKGSTLLSPRDNPTFTSNDGQHIDGHWQSDQILDPHAWLDPENGKLWLVKVADELKRIDPANAESYTQNALAGQQEIDLAVEALRPQLDNLRGQRYIVFHDAYQYFESRFDLPAIGAISVSDATRPSASRVAEIKNLVIREDVQCVVADPLYNKGLVGAVISRNTERVAVIDPLAMDLILSPQLYIKMLQSMVDRLTICLT